MTRKRRPLWIGLAVALGATVAFTSSAFAGHSVRDVVYPAGADVAVSVYGGDATVGHDLAFYVTVSDRGSKAAHGVTMTNTIPAGTSLVTAVTDQGACADVLNTVSCALGDLPSGGHAEIRVITTTPSTPQILGDTASAKATSPHDINRTNNHATGYTQTEPKFPDAVSGYIPPAGGTIGLSHKTTKLHPTSATVRGPRTTDGFQVYLDVYDPEYSEGCPDGATCFGQVVDLEGLSGLTAAHPATVTLRYDPSQIPKRKSVTTTRLYDDYSIVPRCFSTAGKSAAPDPCVVSRSVLANGDWQIVVRVTNGYAQFRL